MGASAFPVPESGIQATTLTTTGDTIYAPSANVAARLGIGSTGQVMTVAGGVPSWATPAAAGGMTLIASGSLGTGSNFTVSSIPQTYKDIRLYLFNWSASGNGDLVWQINATTSNTYYQQSSSNGATNTTGVNGSGYRLSSGTVDGTQTTNMGCMQILNYADTTAFKPIIAQALTWQNGAPSYREAWTGGGSYAAITAVTSILLEPESTSTFDGGTYALYGVN